MWNNRKRQAGFTLLEIIVALAIFAVIVSLIYPAYTGTYRNIDIAESQAEIYEMARTTLIRIIEDIESTYIPKDSNIPQGDEKTAFAGQKDFLEGRRADRLRFFSKSHIDISNTLTEGGDAKIAYYPLIKEDQSISLYRSDTQGNLEWPEENTKGWIICEGLYSISFTYTDKNGDIHDEWDESTADPRNKLPSIINIKLEFIDKDNPEKPITFSTAVALPLVD
jgi:general secretion pathway protein J